MHFKNWGKPNTSVSLKQKDVQLKHALTKVTAQFSEHTVRYHIEVIYGTIPQFIFVQFFLILVL